MITVALDAIPLYFTFTIPAPAAVPATWVPWSPGNAGVRIINLPEKSVWVLISASSPIPIVTPLPFKFLPFAAFNPLTPCAALLFKLRGSSLKICILILLTNGKEAIVLITFLSTLIKTILVVLYFEVTNTAPAFCNSFSTISFLIVAL